MADFININTQTLVDTAKKLDDINGRLDDKLRTINTKMNELESTWQSDAATDIRAAMNAMQPRFDECKRVVASYATFLRNTAQNYESTETAIQASASAFK